MSEVDDSTLTDRNDHLAIRSLEDVSEPVDPRITPDHRPTSEVLDEGYVHQFNEFVHHEKHAHELSQKPGEAEPLYVCHFHFFYVSYVLRILNILTGRVRER